MKFNGKTKDTKSKGSNREVQKSAFIIKQSLTFADPWLIQNKATAVEQYTQCYSRL